MFLALILGIVHSCRSNVTLDMIKKLKNWFFKKFQILQFFAFMKFRLKRMRQLHCFLSEKLLLVAKKNWENKVKIKCLALIWGIAHFCRSNMTKDIVKSMKKLDRKKCKKLQIWNFLKNQFFRILIISKVTFDLEECTIPKIKAKNISFGPYFVNFLAKLNILWERKQWSCLIFFVPDFSFRKWISYL